MSGLDSRTDFNAGFFAPVPRTSDYSFRPRTGSDSPAASTAQSDQLFRDLAESLPQFIWVADACGVKTYCNRKYLEYTGIGSVDEMNRHWQSCIHPDDRNMTAEAWKLCVQSQSPYFSEYRLRRHDGVYRYFLARALPLRNEAGEIYRWLGSSTDVHDQKVAEFALRKAEKLAAAGRLAATVAHEINNPLTALTNSIYLALQDKALGEKTRAYLELAENELARVAHVTTRTLNFHRQSSPPTLANLAQIMDSVLGVFADRIKVTAIEVDKDYQPGASLYCFAQDLRQVFSILVSNSLDATEFGGRLRIRIKTAHSWQGSPVQGIRIIVADTGEGIPTELHDRVFEAFMSTKDSTGTGLGLWVTAGIVRNHRGLIRFRSRTGKACHGTVFSLFFPHDGVPAPAKR